MNEKKAKELRKSIYGDKSQRNPRAYETTSRSKRGGVTGTISNSETSDRAIYQATKRGTANRFK